MGNALVDQTRRRQLGCEPKPEDFVESTLMMVKPLTALVVDGTNVDHDIASVENGEISTPLDI